VQGRKHVRTQGDWDCFVASRIATLPGTQMCWGLKCWTPGNTNCLTDGKQKIYDNVQKLNNN
jgi:hypothetical protein